MKKITAIICAFALAVGLCLVGCSSTSSVKTDEVEEQTEEPEETEEAEPEEPEEAEPEESEETEEAVPEEEPEATSEAEAQEETPAASGGIREDFKEAMDDYEAYMDEYIAFMKKYQSSNGTDLTLLADYAKYLASYTEMTNSFEAWESEDLSNEELSYYLEVQTRVSQKLLDVL